jgi:hypothetical protein
MVPLSDLWLPILLSAVFVFAASSIIHMALRIHKGDFRKLPGEDKVLEAMRAQGLQPGSYMFPCANTMKEMCTPEMVAKQNLGPVGSLTVVPNGPVKMGKHLTQWFVFSLAVGLFTAYAVGLCLPAGTEYIRVFRIAGTVAFMGYGLSNVTDSIWKGVSWSITLKFLLDGLIYALVTAGTFGWLWPKVAAL